MKAAALAAPGQTIPRALPYALRRMNVLCWRCWSVFRFFVLDEFSEAALLRCERCGELQVTGLDCRRAQSTVCLCGGRFRHDYWPSCDRCGARPLRLLSLLSSDNNPGTQYRIVENSEPCPTADSEMGDT